MSRSIAAFALLHSLLLATPAAAQSCPPVAPVACPNCFAVFVMPDTQLYTQENYQPHGAAHLDMVTRYVCRERTAWVEPSTGKQMPILMLIHLGDMVQTGDRTEAGVPLAEWLRVDAAFDNLDACSPQVPYLVTTGNHDYAFNSGYFYENDTLGYETYFGVDRWNAQGYTCSNPKNCNWAAGQWFIGGGDTVLMNSRNHEGEGPTGPTMDFGGRHRAGAIRAPNGQRFLFLGLELAFDYPPDTTGFEGDDAAWPKQVLQDYAGTPTIAFHHSMFLAGPPEEGFPELVYGPETFHSDSIPPGTEEDPIGMQDVFETILEPSEQVLLLFAGHVINPATQGDYTITRASAPPIHGFLRNYQNVKLGGTSGLGSTYGVGWNVIAAFDPDAGEIRVRSYRIDDADAYASPRVDLDHDGEPVATECMDMDYDGVGERIISVDFDSLGGFPQVPALSRAPHVGLAALLLAAALLLLRRASPRCGGRV